jgi:uncharacterized membrane protein
MVIAYPFIGYTLQRLDYDWFLPTVLTLIIGWRAFVSTNQTQRFFLFLLAAVLFIGTTLMSRTTAQLIPVTVYLGLVGFFGRTLMYRPSLIERFVLLQFSEVPDEVLNYCYRLTLVWTVLFAVIVIASMILMVAEQDWYLTLLHGVVAWVLMAVLMLLEPLYRLNRFPFMKGQTPSIKATFDSVMKSKEQLW